MKLSWMKIAASVVFFLFLVWAWPNLVHEPAHWLALQVQGSHGDIYPDWREPFMTDRSPHVTRTAPVAGVVGGIFFMLAPHLVSLAILSVAWLTRRRASLFTHLVLPFYLVMDILVNLMSYKNAVSDFHFLVLVPGWASLVVMAVVTLGGCALVARLWSAYSASASAGAVS